MNALETTAIRCPYCGEHIDITVDTTSPRQAYVEDCLICCRPIQLDVSINDAGEISVTTARDDE
ncbi:MAG TPA: CPXCG motif-containing cysteine-rich protein [Mariprofundaceae bacterium]|nr:CPXCG motif-containing cysteine-rich protein [Mariprofundaceae bacterium]